LDRKHGRLFTGGILAVAAGIVVGIVAVVLQPATAAGAPAGATAGSADKSLVIEGFAQMRWQLDHNGTTDGNQNYFRLRRLRLRATGDWNEYFRVRLQLALQELAKENVAAEILEDAFIRIRKSDALELHFGQYKLPISREELRSSSDQFVVDRSPIVNDNFKRSLWISRDVGLMVAGNFYEHDLPFEYYAGVWNGEGRNRPLDFKDENDAKLFGGRAEYAPVAGLKLAGSFLGNPIQAGGGEYTFASSSFSIPDSLDYSELATIWGADGNFTQPWSSGRFMLEGEILNGTNTRVFAGAVAAALADTTGPALPKPSDEGFIQRGMQLSALALFRTEGVLTGWEIGSRLAHFDPNVDGDDNETTEVAVALGLHFLPEPDINKDRLQFEFTNLSYSAAGRDSDWSIKGQWQVRY
jgi:hypothetical protein